jgi:hypothetical protein
LSRGWIGGMKRTIRTLGWRFNADRMVMALHAKRLYTVGGCDVARHGAGAIANRVHWLCFVKTALADPRQ